MLVILRCEAIAQLRGVEGSVMESDQVCRDQMSCEALQEGVIDPRLLG